VKRLMISGFGCPKAPWISLLGPDTTVISLHDVLKATQSPDLNQWGDFVAAEIRRIRPDSIVAHDFGGAMTLKALMQLQEKRHPVAAKLTLLSCAFRDFDVLKNPHPFLIQVSPWRITQHMIRESGGEVDPELKPWYGMIRKVYRQVIGASFARKMQLKLYSRKKARLDSLDIDLRMPAQIIASPNDPYISMQNLHRIQADFLIPDFHTVAYRHFPYSSPNRESVRQLIQTFEANPRALHAKN
jgi:predicted alpha/beta hydrolase family esterase